MMEQKIDHGLSNEL